MKIQIRQGVFETNSSSVHSMTMCDKSDYEDWKNNEKMFHPSEQKFLPNAEAIEYNNDYVNKHGYNEQDAKSDGYLYLTYDEYFDDYTDWYETFAQKYKGIVAFGYYGHD